MAFVSPISRYPSIQQKEINKICYSDATLEKIKKISVCIAFLGASMIGLSLGFYLVEGISGVSFSASLIASFPSLAKAIAVARAHLLPACVVSGLITTVSFITFHYAMSTLLVRKMNREKLEEKARQDLASGLTELNQACSKGDFETVKRLLAQGVKPGSFDAEEFYAFKHVIRKNDLKLTKLLFEAGADLSKLRIIDFRLLVLNGYDQMIELCLQYGLNPEQKLGRETLLGYARRFQALFQDAIEKGQRISHSRTNDEIKAKADRIVRLLEGAISSKASSL